MKTIVKLMTALMAALKKLTFRKKEQAVQAHEGQETLGNRMANMMEQAIVYLHEHYDMRFNVLDSRAEIRAREVSELTRSGLLAVDAYTPATKALANTLVLQLNAEGIVLWDRDMTRLLHSLRLTPFHPIEAYLAALPAWDGHDRVTPLAQRVSNDALWVEVFGVWMRGMVKQWQGGGQSADGIADYGGNQLAPLLVSREQGLHKSSFCRLLLPPALSDYFTDKYDLASRANLTFPLTRFALINLDEFDSLTGRELTRLKNVMQMGRINAKRPYAAFYEHMHRTASFIGTSNSRELLTDPTGARRFFCQEVAAMIDCNTPLDHAQLYAQLLQELQNGLPYYPDKALEARIEHNNRAFYKASALREAFIRTFDYATTDTSSPLEEAEGWQWMTATEIMSTLMKCYGTRTISGTPSMLGRQLTFLHLQRRHAEAGNVYRVRRKNENYIIKLKWGEKNS